MCKDSELLIALVCDRIFQSITPMQISSSSSPKSRKSQTQVQSTQIAGVATLLAGKRHGKSSANGCGTCAWSWAINLLLIRCAPPSLLLLSHLRKKRPSRLLLSKGTGRQKWPYLGNKAASRGETLLSSLMARSVVPPASRLWLTSGAQKSMGACAWCMRPASAVVALAPCGSSVNGMAAPLPSLVGSVCSYIPSSSGLRPSSGETGTVGTIDERARICSVSNTWRSRWSRASLPAQLSRLRPCPVHSARIIVSTFKSG